MESVVIISSSPVLRLSIPMVVVVPVLVASVQTNVVFVWSEVSLKSCIDKVMVFQSHSHDSVHYLWNPQCYPLPLLTWCLAQLIWSLTLLVWSVVVFVWSFVWTSMLFMCFTLLSTWSSTMSLATWFTGHIAGVCIIAHMIHMWSTGCFTQFSLLWWLSLVWLKLLTWSTDICCHDCHWYDWSCSHDPQGIFHCYGDCPWYVLLLMYTNRILHKCDNLFIILATLYISIFQSHLFCSVVSFLIATR